MSNSFNENGENFSYLLQAARERVTRLSEYISQPDSKPQELFASSLQELDLLLQEIEACQNLQQDNQPNHELFQSQIIDQEMQEREALFSLIFESKVIGIGFGDLQGNIIEANSTFLRLLGYTYEDLRAGKLNCGQITPPEYLQLNEWILEELPKRGMFKPHERECFHKNGSRIPALIEVSLINNLKYQVISLILDISGRRETEKALQASEQRYRLIVDTTRDGIWIIDEKALVIFVNKRIAEMLGYTIEEIQGSSLFDFVDPLYHQNVNTLLENQQSLISNDIDLKFRRKDGTELWGIVSQNINVDVEGKLAGSLGMITDITERKQAERKLAENEEKFQQLANNIEGIFWILDIEPAQFVYISPAFEKIFGLSPEVLYEDFSNLIRGVYPEDRRGVIVAFKRSKETGDFECDYRITLPDGSIRWLSNKGKSILDEQGQLYRVVGITEDITERKEIEEVLKLQGKILDNLTEGVFVTDKDGIIILTNPSMDSLFGYERGYLIGKPVDLLTNYSSEENNRLVTEITETLLQEGFWAGEVINRKKDNSIFLSFCSITPIETSNGKAWVSTLQDITDWKQASLQLQEQAALINQAHDAILVRDMNDRIIFWNNGAEALYGWSADEVMGKTIQQILNRNDVKELAQAKQQLLQNGDWAGELNHITREGREIIVRTRWTLVRDEQGQMQSILDINTDITKQKEVEARLLRTQRLESIGTLAMGIAHDINNILAPILIAIDVLRLRLIDEDSQHFLAMLKINTQRGVDLINQVLAFAKGNKSSRQMLQLKYLINEIIHILEGTLAKSIQLKLSLEDNLSVVLGDSTQILQVLMNLCTNAQDAMPDGGELLIKASNVYIDNLEHKAKSFVKITVADTGIGIPEELLDRIFEPFFTTKEVGKGTGLGLATVIGIIRDHGGFVEVSSRQGGGTRFEVYIPANIENHAYQKNVEEGEFAFGNGEIVLLVDDEVTLGETLKRILEQFGYRILVVNGGEEALQVYAAESNKIKLVLIDIIMPDMNGLTAIHAFHKINPEVKIIAISGLDANTELNEAISLGLVQSFLRKPFTTSLLLKALHGVLGN